MAEYLCVMRERNPALDGLAVCSVCDGVFASIGAANVHEETCPQKVA